MGYEGKTPLPLASGGTAVSTITGILTGNGTSAITASTISQYNTLVAGSSNAVSGISPGTAGQALLSNGSSSNPSYGAVSGANLVYLTSQTANNSSSLNFTSVITGSYTSYRIMFYNIYPVNAGDDLDMKISTDNGSTWIVTNYLAANWSFDYNGTTYTNSNSTTLFPVVSGMTNSTSNNSACGIITLENMGIAQYFIAQGQAGYFGNGSSVKGNFFTATNTANTTVNAFQFLCSTGNISTGTFVVHGIKES